MLPIVIFLFLIVILIFFIILIVVLASLRVTLVIPFLPRLLEYGPIRLDVFRNRAPLPTCTTYIWVILARTHGPIGLDVKPSRARHVEILELQLLDPSL